MHQKTALLSLLAVLMICSMLIQPLQAAPKQPQSISFFGMNTYITGLERIANDGDDGITHLLMAGRTAGVALSLIHI